MNTKIIQNCKHIMEYGKTITIDNEIKLLFNDFVDELNKIQNSKNRVTFLNELRRIVETMFNIVENKYTDPSLLNHDLFIILRDQYIDLLNKWKKNDEVLNDDEQYLFFNIGALLANMTNHVNTNNIQIFKSLLLNQTLIELIKQCLNDVSATGKYLNDNLNLSSLGYIITALQRFQLRQVNIQDDPILSSLLDLVVKCLCSANYTDVFKQLKVESVEDKLNITQTFFLVTCPKYIIHYIGKQRETIYPIISENLLKRCNELFEKFIPLIVNWNKCIIEAMEKLIGILQCISYQHSTLAPYKNEHSKLIVHILTILNAQNLIKQIIDNDDYNQMVSFLIGYCIRYIYYLSLEPNLLIIIQNQNVTQTFYALTEAKDKENKFNCYRMLAIILTEQDVKRLANPRKIASVFTTYLKRAIVDPLWILRLPRLLLSLKIQHEQIKQELINLDAISLLIQCTMEPKFDTITVQQNALEIVLAMTFNEQAATILKTDEKFMSHARSLLSSEVKGLQKVAEGILWKLEQESEYIIEQDKKEQTGPNMQVVDEKLSDREIAASAPITIQRKSTYKYDIMISYSHNDKELCYRIQEQLLKDNFRVWLDRDNLYGATMHSMADAIEYSEFVLICMSDSYKQSVYCQSEAHYAFERRCHIIPLIMKSQYRPDGWLGFIVSGKIYIDFPKLNFDAAYQKLKMEIQQYRTQKNDIKQSCANGERLIHLDQEQSVNRDSITEKIPDNVVRKISAYANCVVSWTEENVKDFLTDKNLEAMIPLCENMDGQALHRFYQMCQTNFDAMYQSSKTELLELHKKILPINVYIRFITELKKYVPICDLKDKKEQTGPNMQVVDEKLSDREIAASAPITIQRKPTYKYDIMISYSHNDKELCYRIQEQLLKDNFRVLSYGQKLNEEMKRVVNQFLSILMVLVKIMHLSRSAHENCIFSVRRDERQNSYVLLDLLYT
ncbi:unnamed protein product [Didymodactylos carnosus]|uniref:TIR domain-containing protein n=1 Tax=Didymodactylos carnosus TaxID=1234261 RepID=A0A8S2KQQ6_9BILA|nr:unnamed protein product [Didymodactylos carnosus]CAF3849904.1 unnamed protein product [Didymodactylos carnosus]